MATPELYDQTGYLLRLGVGGALRIDGKLIRSRDVSVVGHIEILSEREHDREPIIEPARRITALAADTVLAIVVADPDNGGHDLRRITCYGCRFDPPAAHPIDRGSRLMVAASFKSERYEDA